MPVAIKLDLPSKTPVAPDVFPFQFLSDLGFSQVDQLILVLCPLIAMIGCLAKLSTLMLNFGAQASYHTTFSKIFFIVLKTLSRLLIASIAGLLVGFYFAGAISPTAQSVGKLLGLALLVGYMSEKFFYVLEKRTIEDLSSSVLNFRVNDANKTNTADAKSGGAPRSVK